MNYQTRFRPDQVDPSAYITPGAVVVGDVTLGPQASVWFNAVLRGDCEAIRVGARSNIQDGCVLHADPGFPCILGEGVTVGHAAIVHAAVVEDGALIGMRAVVLDGARVGAESLVAAGSVVPPGMQVPPRSLVIGVPARVKRELTEAELAHNRYAAEHYVEAAAAFRRGD